MARRLRAALSLLVAAAVVVLSPGLEAPRLFAQVVVRAVPVETAAPVAGAASLSFLPAPAALAPSALGAAPSLAAQSAFAAAPALAAAPSAAASASLPELARALAPNLEAAAKPDVTASGAAAAGRGIEDAITGQRSAGSGGVAGATVEGPAVSAAAPLAAASAPSEAPKPGVPAAPAPAAAKALNSAASYRVHRFLLNTVAALTGAVFTQPAAGPALTRALIKSAAERRAVFSDYDDTLAAYNQVLPQDMVEAVEAVKAAGKDFVVISDRGDEPRAHQLTVFESLASLPIETRAGMYVAANSGGRVYRYDETGTPVRVFEAPALDEASKAKVAEAAEATKARLNEIGAEQHFPSAANNNPSESWGTYGYAMMLKVGSSNEQVRGAADILHAELAKRGLNVEVNPRFAKDPANPPYINFSIVTKEASSAFIAKALKLAPKDVVVIGDSMYAPHEAKTSSWLTRLGEKLSGRAMPQTGNRTDANMEKAIPGALTLSVGATGDPRTSNLWVLGGKGPAVTREVLMSLASKSRAALDVKGYSAETALDVVGAVSIVAGAAAAYYFVGHAAIDCLRQIEQQLHQNAREVMDGSMLFGGMLGAVRARVFSGKEFLANPGDSYGEARRRAVELAAARGVPADQVLFVRATASIPVRDSAHWGYAFSIPGKGGRRTLIYADAKGSFGGAPEIRTSVYENAPDQDALAKSLRAFAFRMGTKGLDPDRALDAARKALPGMSSGVGISLDYREEAVSGDGDLWYRFFDDKGAIVAVNARTSEARVESPLPAAETGRWAAAKSAAATIGLIAATAGIYALIYWAIAHAPAATSGIQVPPGYQGPIPSNMDIGTMFGGALGLAGAAGALRAVKKTKVSDDEIAAAVTSVVAYKGGVWSQTEYNVGYYNSLESLTKRGATKAQLERFRKLCDAAPVIGGRFNSWSGD